MNKFLIMILVSMTCFPAYAEKVFVTDSLKFNLRTEANTSSRILKVLESGTPLTLINSSPAGYSKVRTTDDITGFLLTRYTLPKPTHSWYLQKANKKLVRLESENGHLKTELDTLKLENSKNQNENKTLSDEHYKINKEFNELQQTSANAIQTKLQRDQLQERVVNVERELQQLKVEKKALEDSTSQDWFIYGGILAFAGIFLGLIIPRISWHRKTSSWDSF